MTSQSPYHEFFNRLTFSGESIYNYTFDTSIFNPLNVVRRLNFNDDIETDDTSHAETEAMTDTETDTESDIETASMTDDETDMEFDEEIDLEFDIEIQDQSTQPSFANNF